MDNLPQSKMDNLPQSKMDNLQQSKMNAKKNLRKSKVVKSAKVLRTVPVEESLNYFDKLAGVYKVELSPLTQIFINCRVGENITPDNPWVLTHKEKLVDNLELYEKDSDFYPIQDYILNSPEDELLIGSNDYIQDDKVLFYVVTDIESKKQILKIMEEHKNAINNRILQSLSPISKLWMSLGSEIVVNADMIICTRPLIEVKLDACTSTLLQKTNFQLNMVENLYNGYKELLPGRIPINIVFKKRIDQTAQAAPLKKTKSVQGSFSTKFLKSTQYFYEYAEIQITEKLLKKILEFLINNIGEMCHKLDLNFSLNLFTNDYIMLKKNPPVISLSEPVEIRSYQDVNYCKQMKISCLSWNAVISGIIAAAYMRTPNFCISHTDLANNDPFESVFHQHLVLIWYYNDNVRPKFYLHATRTVTALSFCPYNAYILVCGYSNGQIAVYDLTNQLNAKEYQEFLNNREQENWEVIARQTQWFKKPLGPKHVFPILTSAFEISHNSAITSIGWIPASHYISSRRKYVTSPPDEQHMQFLTAGLNGSKILVWDLFDSNPNATWSRKKRSNRLPKLPDALTIIDSPLKRLQQEFRPVCRLLVSGQNIPVTNILIKNQVYYYSAKNPSTLNNIDEITYFRVMGLLYPFDYEQKIAFTTGTGTLHIATWDGADFDQGILIPSEKCHVISLSVIHDGPITICETNSFFPDLILTIGGSIFAIWDCTKIHSPLIWRKCKFRYMSGMWSFLHPLSFIVIRKDRYYEFWNLFERSNIPIQIFKYKGYDLIKFYSDSAKMHTRKKTFITTDTAGAFKIFNLPSAAVKRPISNMIETEEYIDRVVETRKYIETFKINYKLGMESKKAKQEESTEDIQDNIPPPAPPPVLETSDMHLEKKNVFQYVAVNSWKQRLEKHMHRILLEQKKLNLAEIEANRKPLEKMIGESQERKKKVGEEVFKRNKILHKTKQLVIINHPSKLLQQSFAIKFSKEARINIKKMYMENFREIENNILKLIKIEQYDFEFDWMKMITYPRNRIKRTRVLKNISDITVTKNAEEFHVVEFDSTYCNK